jgi:hypothetical protein
VTNGINIHPRTKLRPVEVSTRLVWAIAQEEEGGSTRCGRQSESR